MASTTNFNWSTPDDTSLVKDGAAAIRTLGQSIDTSMAELKGGTTGQVLSKTSNTDMDFTWVAQDDSNAIQNAIVDAKGDLIAATAADTPARLAVGGNTAPLVADSAEATGLRWDNSAWTSYTPTWTSAGGTNPTLGNGTITGKYKQRGKVVDVRITLTVGSTSTIGTGIYLFSLPVNNATTEISGIDSHGWLLDTSTGLYYHIFCDSASSAGTIVVRLAVTTGTWATLDTVQHNTPMTFATGDFLGISLSYEAA